MLTEYRCGNLSWLELLAAPFKASASKASADFVSIPDWLLDVRRAGQLEEVFCMKILHIAQSVAGGIASYLDELVPLQSIEFGESMVKVLAPLDQRHHLDLGESQMLYFKSSKRSLHHLIAFAFKSIKTIHTYKPNIVHLHSTFSGFAVRLWYLILPVKRPKIVYCAHGWSFTMQVGEVFRKFFAFFERVLSRTTDIIINISKSEQTQASHFGLPMPKMVVIHNGIRRKDFTVLHHSAAELRDLRSDGINLLFLGRLDPQKGFSDLLKALERVDHSSIHLHVIGSSVLSDSRRALAMQGFGNIVFHGWQPRERAFAFIQSCDAIIVPSRWEGFGLVVIEAMRMARPAVVSDAGALPELVQHERNGLVFETGNVDQLAAILSKLDKQHLADLGKAARAVFLQRFTSDKMSKAVSDVYRSLTSDAVDLGGVESKLPPIDTP